MAGQNRELFHAGHYAVIAKRIREARACYPVVDTVADSTGASNIKVQEALDMVVKDLGAWFVEDNPRFDLSQWYEVTDSDTSKESWD